MMPNGLLLGYRQWGFYACNASQSYPIAFSINPYCIAASVLASTTDSNYYSISVDNDSNKSFLLNGWRDNVKMVHTLHSL